MSLGLMIPPGVGQIGLEGALDKGLELVLDTCDTIGEETGLVDGPIWPDVDDSAARARLIS